MPWSSLQILHTSWGLELWAQLGCCVLALKAKWGFWSLWFAARSSGFIYFFAVTKKLLQLQKNHNNNGKQHPSTHTQLFLPLAVFTRIIVSSYFTHVVLALVSFGSFASLWWQNPIGRGSLGEVCSTSWLLTRLWHINLKCSFSFSESDVDQWLNCTV